MDMTSLLISGSVVQWLGHWTRDGQVVSSTPMQPLHCRATTLGKLFIPMCLCSPSSIIWYLARAFMSMCLYVAAIWQGPNEEGGVLQQRFCSDRIVQNRNINYLLYFCFFTFSTSDYLIYYVPYFYCPVLFSIKNFTCWQQFPTKTL